MTTVDEAREALLRVCDDTGERAAAFEAAVRAEGETKYRRAMAVAADFRRERDDSAAKLAALREAAMRLVSATDDLDNFDEAHGYAIASTAERDALSGAINAAWDALRAALDATEAEPHA